MGKNGASQVLGQERREDSELNIKKIIINKAVEVKGVEKCVGTFGFCYWNSL